MKKIFNKLTKILIVLSILIVELVPSISVLAVTGPSALIKVYDNATSDYVEIENNSNYSFSQATLISNYQFKIDGSDFEDTTRYFIKLNFDFYGVWDANTKFGSKDYVLIKTGLELNSGVDFSLPYDVISMTNGTYKVNISTYELSGMELNSTDLNTKTDLELEAINADLVSLDLSSYVKITNNNFNFNVIDYKYGFIVEEVKDYNSNELTKLEDVYQFDAATSNGLSISFNYDIGNINPSEFYHINCVINDVATLISNNYAANDLKTGSSLNAINLINGVHVIKFELYDSNNNLISDDEVSINVINSIINADLNTYFTIDDVVKDDYNKLLSIVTNYNTLSDADKALLDENIINEMDYYTTHFNNLLHEKEINNNLNQYGLKANSFYKIKSQETSIIYGLDGMFDKTSIAVPTNINILDFKKMFEDAYEIQMGQEVLKNVTVDIFDKDGNLVPNTDYIQTGMKVKLNYYSMVFEYTIVVRGNVLSDDGKIKTDDIREAINLAINSSSLGNAYYLASDVNKNDVVDVLDITEMTYILNNNNNEDTFTDFDNNNPNLIMQDDIITVLETDASGLRVGDTFDISLMVSGLTNDKINGLEGLLNFDSKIAKCNSVSVSNNWIGNINVINTDSYGKFMYAGTDEVTDDTKIITFTFEALAKGEFKISVSDLMAALNGREIRLKSKLSNELSINIDRALSSNANIKELKHNKGWLGSTFSADTLSYKLFVDYRVKNINLNGVLEDVNAKSDGFKEYELTDNKTIIPIKVVAENGDTKTYTIEVIKIDTRSSNNYLEDLRIGGYEIEFDKNTFEYSINVKSNVNTLDITAIAEDENATVDIVGNAKLQEGLNEIKLVVTAEDKSVREYIVKVTKEKEEEEKIDLNEEEEKPTKNSKLLLIILIIATICGLLYLVFKDGDSNKKTIEDFKLKDKNNNKKK